LKAVIHGISDPHIGLDMSMNLSISDKSQLDGEHVRIIASRTSYVLGLRYRPVDSICVGIAIAVHWPLS